MESVTTLAFENFVGFYHENRDRFELSSRKKWDEVTASLTVPNNFYWASERKDGYDAMIIGWSTRGGRYQYEFPLYEIHYHKWTGKAALGHMADLGDKLEELNPTLGDAMALLIEFNDDVEDLAVWYNVDINTGKLLLFKAIRAKGLLQVKAEIEEE
jgi:hypothetical protein